jgi:hypothetical protein
VSRLIELPNPFLDLFSQLVFELPPQLVLGFPPQLALDLIEEFFFAFVAGIMSRSKARIRRCCGPYGLS